MGFYAVLKISGWRAVFQTALLSLVLLSGCSRGQAERPMIEYAHAGQAFPVTIHNAQGSVTLQQAPKRVVALGTGAEDIAVELGVLPVAVEAHPWGGDGQGYLPWFKEYLAERDLPLPPTLNMYPELDVEKLVSLQPDLVLAPQSGLSDEEYRQLSSFAPVVAYPHRAWLTTIDEQIDLAAAALGRQEAGQALKARRAGFFADFRRRHPQLQGLTFAYIYAGGRDVNLSLYLHGDPRVDTLSDLGLRFLPSLENIRAKPGSIAGTLGLENVDRLDDADIVVTWFSSEADRDVAGSRPLYQMIPAVRRGSYLPITDKTLAVAMSVGTPLSTRWGVERFLPMLEQAALRVPKQKEQP
ncbi:iron-siderophore ABC transporter substrate-binding protein [Uruburuella testudinis]|uniref:Iron-siderophore ABC transporter substrate-binding protein n=1 Tax=Uruburuella testudinis TaxID=1282863 RepID=A0ABY4DV01_9NEIS|nr:iron-siderophore ABC transporter substrate-binding protein [Uruburuella testudinis]UOO82288.1 iron-siderophore ABC transporter substrate-binding protein [Uruburuella testudinis]